MSTMNILFFADIHGDMKVINHLKKKAGEADIVVCAGDISRMENNLSNIVSELNDFGKPVLLIHGNHEDEDGLRELCEQFDNVIFLHKAVHKVGKYIFMGYGGDGFSSNDTQFTRVANLFFKPESKDMEKIILVTHGPPHGTELDLINGDHRGNKSYREFIDDIKPHLVVSGHLHENFGKHEKIDRTLFINPGKAGMFVKI